MTLSIATTLPMPVLPYGVRNALGLMMVGFMMYNYIGGLGIFMIDFNLRLLFQFFFFVVTRLLKQDSLADLKQIYVDNLWLFAFTLLFTPNVLTNYLDRILLCLQTLSILTTMLHNVRRKFYLCLLLDISLLSVIIRFFLSAGASQMVDGTMVLWGVDFPMSAKMVYITWLLPTYYMHGRLNPNATWMLYHTLSTVIAMVSGSFWNVRLFSAVHGDVLSEVLVTDELFGGKTSLNLIKAYDRYVYGLFALLNVAFCIMFHMNILV